MTQRFRRALAFVVLLTAVGTLGYRIIEAASWFDSFYMVVITITTVGFAEVFPLSFAGQVWTTFLIISGLGAVLYTASVGLELAVDSASISGRNRRMQREIDRQENHHIVCGYGRIGSAVWRDLQAAGESAVVIEYDEDRADSARAAGALVIEEDATTDRALTNAGLQKAASVIACVHSDADNLVIALSAKAMTPEIHVIARAGAAEFEEKLHLAGADRVVAPNRVGARRMAVMAVQRGFGDVVEFVMQGSRHFELRVERISVAGWLVGQTLKSAAIRERFGVMVVGIDAPDVGVEVNPSPDTPLRLGESLVAIGTVQQLDHLREIVDTDSVAE